MKFGVIAFFFCCFAVSVRGQEVRVIKYPELLKIIDEKGTELKVINFWATWCKPCIEELGLFEELNKQSSAENVKVLLVSLDFVEDLDTKVKRFISRRELKSQVLLLDETDYNAFIDKVSPEWSGAIPATLIVNSASGKKMFYEKQFKEGELQQALRTFTNEGLQKQ